MQSNLDRLLNDPQRLAALHRLSILDTPTEPAFDRLTRLAARIIRVPVAVVTFLDHDREFAKSQVGLPEPVATNRVLPLSYSLCQHSIPTGQPLIIDDARIDPIGVDNLSVSRLGAVAFAGIPLITDDGSVVGSFCVIDTIPRTWNDDEITVLTELAASVMTEIALRTELEERRKAQAQLQVLLAKEKELSDFKTRVFSLITHEFRNPLASILSADTLLQRYGDRLSEERKIECMKQIEDQVHNLIALTDDLLILGKADLPDVASSRVEVDPAVFCQSVVADMQQTAANHTLEFSVTGSSGRMLLDTKLMRHALLNLLSNAIKYSAPDSTITLRLACAPDQIEIVVQDQGIGIPATDIDTLFTEFHRAANVGDIPGTGLGLVIVKRAVDSHGGKVDVQSEPDAGTTFTISLPRTEPMPTA